MRTIKNCMLSSETILLSDAEMMSVHGGGIPWGKIVKFIKKYGLTVVEAIATYWAARGCDEAFDGTDEEEIEVDYVYWGGDLEPAYCYG